MHAESARHRHGINKPRERCPAGKTEIISLGQQEPRHALGWIALRRARQPLGAAAGTIAHRIEAEPLRLATADRGLPAAARGAQPLDRTIECDHAAPVFEVAVQRQHVAVTVDNAGFRRVHRGNAGKRRLETLGRSGVNDLDPSTPLSCACLYTASNRSISPPLVATTSLPHLRCGTPCETPNS